MQMLAQPVWLIQFDICCPQVKLLGYFHIFFFYNIFYIFDAISDSKTETNSLIHQKLLYFHKVILLIKSRTHLPDQFSLVIFVDNDSMRTWSYISTERANFVILFCHRLHTPYAKMMFASQFAGFHHQQHTYCTFRFNNLSLLTPFFFIFINPIHFDVPSIFKGDFWVHYKKRYC